MWLVSCGQSARQVAAHTGYSASWFAQSARRDTEQGLAGMVNRRRTHAQRAPTLLASAQLEEVRGAVSGPAPEGERWTSRTVAEWMAQRLGRQVPQQRGWDSVRNPRPRHVAASALEHDACTRGPRAEPCGGDRVCCGAGRTVGHRRAARRAQPIRRRVWTLPGACPLAPVAPRSQWRYVVALVDPASGRSVGHRATGVSTDRFSAALAAVAAAVGAGPR